MVLVKIGFEVEGVHDLLIGEVDLVVEEVQVRESDKPGYEPTFARGDAPRGQGVALTALSIA